MTKALIISSDKEARFAYEQAIAFQKFAVETAENIKTAVSKLTQNWPDLIVLDFDETTAAEIEELRQLKPQKKDLPVIIITDLDDTAKSSKACVLGACRYLSKSKSTLGDLIKEVRKATK